MTRHASATLRSMNEDDIDQVVAIEQASFAIPWTREAFERELSSNEYANYVVIEEAGALVGYCGMWLVLDECHITNIAVLPEFRGKGFGKVLLQEALQRAKAAGARTATLEVRVSNEPAQRLYRSFGFLNGGLRKRYYTDNYEDALVMWVNI